MKRDSIIPNRNRSSGASGLGLLPRLLAILILLFPSLPLPALAQSSCPVGRYGVDGRTASGSPYRGEAVIESYGSSCNIRWLAPNTSQGSGYVSNGRFVVNYTMAGQAGTVTYDMGSDGRMHGTWWPNSRPWETGRETLIPLGVGQAYAPPPSTNSSASNDAAALAALGLFGLLVLGAAGSGGDSYSPGANDRQCFDDVEPNTLHPIQTCWCGNVRC